jgi:hypothetical protein
MRYHKVPTRSNGKKLCENFHFELGVNNGDFKFVLVGGIPANIAEEIV